MDMSMGLKKSISLNTQKKLNLFGKIGGGRDGRVANENKSVLKCELFCIHIKQKKAIIPKKFHASNVIIHHLKNRTVITTALLVLQDNYDYKETLSELYG
jgi:hypothetical protein